MSRPQKCRKIGFSPDFTFFKPAGIPGKMLEEIQLTIDEFEAVRLSDLEGLYHENAAKRMNISRQTFSNILSSAHNKIADCLVNGKILRIRGGTIDVLNDRNFICSVCKHEWAVPSGTGRPSNCPSCKSTNFHRSDQDREPRRNMS
jgi:predicted DNA-binding protein (UPF0251 family)